ncbi:Chitin synthase, class 3 [Chytridiales sp. JEL 0842]|nr:Chitin synthase, class 3 [Chytridiales sp. JEL 0842]
MHTASSSNPTPEQAPISASQAAALSLKRRRQMGSHPLSDIHNQLIPPSQYPSLTRSTRTRPRKERKRCCAHPWSLTTNILTFYIPSFLLERIGKKTPEVQQAYREKVALCTIIFLMMVLVGFLTFGFQPVLCGPLETVRLSEMKGRGVLGVHGRAFSVESTGGAEKLRHPDVNGVNLQNVLRQAGREGVDLSLLFPPPSSSGPCAPFANRQQQTLGNPLFPCAARLSTGQTFWPNASLPFRPALTSTAGCHPPTTDLERYLTPKGLIVVEWEDLRQGGVGEEWVVYNGWVLDLTFYFSVASNSTTRGGIFDPTLVQLLRTNTALDSTLPLLRSPYRAQADCLSAYFRVASISPTSTGCLCATVVVNLSFVVIVLVVLGRFVLAVWFRWCGGGRRGWGFKSGKRKVPLKVARAEKKAGKGEGEKGEGLEMRKVERGRDVVARPLVHGIPNGSSTTTTTAAQKRTSVMLQARERAHMSLRTPLKDLYLLPHPTPNPDTLHDPSLMHTLVLVPCYSESESSLRATLDSIANATYPDTHKCIVVVADGIVTGAGNLKSTPEILRGMIEVDERFEEEGGEEGGGLSYVAIAEGVNRRNCARVYAGTYRYVSQQQQQVEEEEDEEEEKGEAGEGEGSEEEGTEEGTLGSRWSFDEEGNGVAGTPTRQKFRKETLKKEKKKKVPMLLIIKTGNEEENDPVNPSSKPGNRGKRDSQALLMNFLSKVTFDDRMTELEFDIFWKLYTVTGVHPDRYEACLMVDADTRIYPDSLTHMVGCLLEDDRVMGLCGETQVLNKWDSWVTMIQVFEYFVSHHLAKSFESVFGGVTCLPGCFSMFRIKTPKGGDGFWVPLLVNPQVVEAYSENVVDTLHKKNLLLLGEDRFLSTLMLKSFFPRRKMVFVPQAVCDTVVPETFGVLLSQRRRWINSTIHNLMELVFVRDLCGTFCISMQFVIFMELVGTVVLPAAISFTLSLVVMALLKIGDTTLPLLLLAIILGLPAVLILVTANEIIYIFWMGVYILSLPIWNLVLPLYAFWHFDDFSWGQTRKTEGEEEEGEGHGKGEGEFDSRGIRMRRWREWVGVRREEEVRREMERWGRGEGLRRMSAQQQRLSFLNALPVSVGGLGPLPMGVPPPPSPGIHSRQLPTVGSMPQAVAGGGSQRHLLPPAPWISPQSSNHHEGLPPLGPPSPVIVSPTASKSSNSNNNHNHNSKDTDTPTLPNVELPDHHSPHPHASPFYPSVSRLSSFSPHFFPHSPISPVPLHSPHSPTVPYMSPSTSSSSFHTSMMNQHDHRASVSASSGLPSPLLPVSVLGGSMGYYTPNMNNAQGTTGGSGGGSGGHGVLHGLGLLDRRLSEMDGGVVYAGSSSMQNRDGQGYRPTPPPRRGSVGMSGWEVSRK